jgi:far upstream element-binding protein
MADADAAPPTPPPEDNKRKLEEVSADAKANGTGEDAKRPRMDGEPDAATAHRR